MWVWNSGMRWSRNRLMNGWRSFGDALEDFLCGELSIVQQMMRDSFVGSAIW